MGYSREPRPEPEVIVRRPRSATAAKAEPLLEQKNNVVKLYEPDPSVEKRLGRILHVAEIVGLENTTGNDYEQGVFGQFEPGPAYDEKKVAQALVEGRAKHLRTGAGTDWDMAVALMHQPNWYEGDPTNPGRRVFAELRQAIGRRLHLTSEQAKDLHAYTFVGKNSLLDTRGVDAWVEYGRLGVPLDITLNQRKLDGDASPKNDGRLVFGRMYLPEEDKFEYAKDIEALAQRIIYMMEQRQKEL